MNGACGTFRRLCRWTLVACFLTVGVLLGGTRILHGVVTQNGKPIERAVVKLENPRTLVIRSFVTGKDGRYHFAGIRTEFDYEVWADHGNLKSSKEYCSRFDTDPTPTINLTLH